LVAWLREGVDACTGGRRGRVGGGWWVIVCGKETRAGDLELVRGSDPSAVGGAGILRCDGADCDYDGCMVAGPPGEKGIVNT